MSIQRQMTVIGGLGLLLGLALLIVPQLTMGLVGLSLDGSGAFGARLLGASTLAWGLLGLTARGVPGRAGLGAIVGGLFVGLLVGTLLAIWGTLSGQLNSLGWVAVVVMALSTVATGLYRFTGRGS